MLQKLKKSIKKRLLETIAEVECKISKKWVNNAHRRLFNAQWAIPPPPEWFDHNIDLHYKWSATRESFWLERGVFGKLALKQNGNVLELACGDGFNAKHFYSLHSNKVVACDFDETAIATAIKKNSAPNIEFALADIRDNMPNGNFDTIIWDAAIEHFTPEEIDSILKNIKKRLNKQGILSGYTIVERKDGSGKQLVHHEYEFKDMGDLKRFFEPYFKNVRVFETIYPERHNLYFWASDGIIPFDKNWEHQI